MTNLTNITTIYTTYNKIYTTQGLVILMHNR